MLPHKGGKIPETAFQTDRLALNRLQKEGIAIPDGVILEQRNPKVCRSARALTIGSIHFILRKMQVHAYAVNDLRPVFKVYHTSDDRYTPSEGQYLHYVEPAGTAETTYPIPKYTEDTVIVNPPPLRSAFHPIYKSFSLPNVLLQNPQFGTTYQWCIWRVTVN